MEVRSRVKVCSVFVGFSLSLESSIVGGFSRGLCFYLILIKFGFLEFNMVVWGG